MRVPERRIHLAGARNCRDLGGYLTQSGAMVRWRQVLRSDSLDGLCDADAAVLVAELGEAPLAVDLRLVLDDYDGPDPLFVPGVALEQVYAVMLRKAGPRIVQVLAALAESRRPAVFHCGLGRDRTGLMAAVLLGVLGVGDDDIARDYALSASVLPVLIERGRSDRLPSMAFPAEAYDASAQTMRALLRSLRADHGSVTGFALDMGAEVELVESLRDRLLW